MIMTINNQCQNELHNELHPKFMQTGHNIQQENMAEVTAGKLKKRCQVPGKESGI